MGQLIKIYDKMKHMIATRSITFHANTRKMYLSTSDGEVARVKHPMVMSIEVLC